MLKRRKLMVVLIAVAGLLLMVTATAVASPELLPKEQLGKSIFFDENLSINQNQSCASCHAPEAGWVGPDSDVNAGVTIYEGSITDSFGNRKPPSAAYATLSPIFYMDKKGLFVGGNFWDGRATGEKLGNPAADQAQGPFLNPLEQALPDSACVVYRVCNPVVPSDYPVSFEEVWGAGSCDINWPADVEAVCAFEGTTVALSPEDRAKSDMAYDKIALLIAAYEDSAEVNAFTSKYDYTFDGQSKLSKEEQRGFALFQGKGKCKLCHLSGKDALFTDFTFDNLGIPKNPENPFYYADPAFNPDGYAWIDLGLGGVLGSRPEYADYASESQGMHKVPTLRNVDLRPYPDFVKAYGHNGYFKSLEGIVHFYNTRDVLPTCPGDYTEAQALADNCWPAPEVSVNVNTAELGNLGLSADEEAAIVAFMKTLSDGYMP
jgi:cytochrome c peroxidase